MSFDPDEVDLSILLSFPRSGSNFLQNVVKSNASGIHCTSAYADGQFRRQRAMLKSHAVDKDTLAMELRETWNRTLPQSATIVLIRDPRDLMISYYDFLQTVFVDELTEDTMFDHDFNWLKAEYRRRKKTGIRSSYKERPDANEPLFSVADALRGWCANWVGQAADPAWLTVRYEDLVLNPQESFGTIFDYLNLPRPASYDALNALVSLHGESTRPRGKAMGWMHAPEFYRPILDRATAEFGLVMDQMGYGPV